MNVVQPTNGMVITQNTTFVPGVYSLPDGITVGADGITIDGGGVVLVGDGRKGRGVSLNGRRNVVLRKLQIRDYHHGIHAEDCENITLTGNRVTSTAEVPPNTIFLDIWLGPVEAYGGGVCLVRCTNSRVENNDLQHQQNGLLTYHCTKLTVTQNQCSYNSGYGIHLFGTCESLFEANSADYCCRFEPREGGRHHGHMGADATGFLAVMGSCCNTFRRNTARMGGDGFFLAGLAPDGTKCGCNDNLFEENDGSLSPNIAFEATFCRGNRFLHNYADRCNYGFWLGFSWDTEILGNRMIMNRQAGIAVENGHGFVVRGNTFQGNGHGILLWSKYVPKFAMAYPESETCYDWQIEQNTFKSNGRGLRIAADQDHGIRSMPADTCGRPELRPRNIRIRENDIQDNRVGVELVGASEITVTGNTLGHNVEADLRQDDCLGTNASANLGDEGGYL